VRRGRADVGEHAELARAVGEHELNRLARVVRHGERDHQHAAERLALAAVDEHHAHALDDLALGLHREHRAVGEVDDGVVRGREVEHTVRMVAVLVRDQQAVDVRGLETQAREAPFGDGQIEAAVDEHAGVIGLGDQAVAAATAR
jgi:hypothetical protein